MRMEQELAQRQLVSRFRLPLGFPLPLNLQLFWIAGQDNPSSLRGSVLGSFVGVVKSMGMCVLNCCVASSCLRTVPDVCLGRGRLNSWQGGPDYRKFFQPRAPRWKLVGLAILKNAWFHKQCDCCPILVVHQPNDFPDKGLLGSACPTLAQPLPEFGRHSTQPEWSGKAWNF